MELIELKFDNVKMTNETVTFEEHQEKTRHVSTQTLNGKVQVNVSQFLTMLGKLSPSTKKPKE